jgi:HD-GYP domain-containing protein (c-di-GMP phosphodiesterase class II)
MIDFHKGFEEYESLGARKPEKKESKISLSEDASKVSLTDDSQKMSKMETLYSEVRSFVREQFELVQSKQEKKLNFKGIIETAEHICDAFEKKEYPGGYIRLFFEHDEYRENYIYSHSVNVCFMCMRIAVNLNYSRKKLQDLAISALFHDLGMMKIPFDIWNREGSLTASEYKQVQEHPLLGEGIFTNIEGIDEVVPLVIGQHQEKSDGSGYPGNFLSDNVHYMARLISLVDRYEAQTHTRKWKKKELPDKAIQDLLDRQTGKFDPYFMKVLLRVVSIYPEGSYVRLSSGEICKVVGTNEDKPMRPVVNILYNSSKKRLPGDKILDLSRQMLVHVDKCMDPGDL